MITKNKLILFAGPPKTGTTWFYDALKDEPGVSVVGGKENLNYKKISYQKKLLEKLNTSNKHLIIFDHDIFINDFTADEINFFKNKKVVLIIIYRDQLSRSISQIKQLIKVGDLTFRKDKLIFNKKMEKRVYDASNYNKFFNKIKKYQIRFNIILFDDLRKDPNKLYKAFANHFNFFIGEKDKLNLKSNPAQKLKYSFAIKISRKFLKPFLINFIGNKSWTRIKKFFLLNLPSKKFSSREEQIIKNSINLNQIEIDKNFLSKYKKSIIRI